MNVKDFIKDSVARIYGLNHNSTEKPKKENKTAISSLITDGKLND